MTCIPVKDGIICIPEFYYQCPHCHKRWYDYNDMRLNRINKNKSGYTKVKCVKCGKNFFMTYNTKGEFVTWK
jgi:RNase P subunit RPR2